jgi:hypothetical protein
VSLGERKPSVSRFLHVAELCLLQGISPRSLPQGTRVSTVRRAAANAMTVPVVGTALNAALLAAASAASAADASAASAACDAGRPPQKRAKIR